MTKWRYHGKAQVDAKDPAAWASCARCGFNFNITDLRWQIKWAGNALMNTKLLVCSSCYDDPSPFRRVLSLPADPDPIINARPEPYLIDETDWRITEDAAAFRILEDESAIRVKESNATEATDESTG
jgi:hypothetical protein